MNDFQNYFGVQVDPENLQIWFPDLWAAFVKKVDEIIAEHNSRYEDGPDYSCWIEMEDFLESAVEWQALQDAFFEKFQFDLSLLSVDGSCYIWGGDYKAWRQALIFVVEKALVIDPKLQNIPGFNVFDVAKD